MKTKLLLASTLLLLITSCAPVIIPADTATGTYTGQYTYNASVYSNIQAVVTKQNDNTVTIVFSGTGISTLTITNISVVVGDNSTALSKSSGMGESLSGAVEDNELSVSYGFIGGAVTYVGTK